MQQHLKSRHLLIPKDPPQTFHVSSRQQRNGQSYLPPLSASQYSATVVSG